MTRRSHFGWMAVGGLLCLFGIVLACKWRDSSRAMGQSEPPKAVELPKLEIEPPPLPGAATPPAPPSEISTADLKVPAPPPPPPAPVPEVKVEIPPAPSTPPPVATPPEVKVELPPPAPRTSGIVIPTSATVPVTPPPGSAVLPPITTPPAPPAIVVPPPVEAPPTPQIEVKAPVVRDVPGEPPLAPTPGPVVQFKVTSSGETFKTLAKKTLGSSERWGDIHKLNPIYRTDAAFPIGTTVRLPGDACVEEAGESVRALPTLRARPATKPKAALPLTGTYPVTIDDHKTMSLPRTLVEQLGNCDTVLLSPGSDKCLWLTNQAHLDRLQSKLDKSPARESDVRGFKRLYYAQVVKVPIKDGRVVITDKLAAFAGLGAEVILVGIDDHFEVWDAARWRKYTQANKAAATLED